MTPGREPEIETAAARHVVGTAGNYTMQTRHTIPAQWQAFHAAGHEIANAVPGARYGVSFGGDGEGGFRYVVGTEVSPVPDILPQGCCTVRLSGGKYAVARAFGPLSGLPATFDWLFSGWLPQSEYRLRAGPTFERYPDDARNGALGMAYEIWVPVARRARKKA